MMILSVVRCSPVSLRGNGAAQPLGQPDSPKAALLGTLPASRSGNRLPPTLDSSS